LTDLQLQLLPAAHCVQPKHVRRVTKPSNLKLLFGALDLDNEEEPGRVYLSVSQVQVHPGWDYESESFDDDVAVLVLEKNIEFTQFVRPICLLETIGNSDRGVIGGWGRNADSDDEKLPTKINVAIINSNEECYRQNFVLATIGWEKSFCAGATNVKVCGGDSGSGLVVNIDDTYYLKGILSSSDSDATTRCTANNLAVYADVPKYLNFIAGQGEFRDC
jgi:secreted trypsin-like serine protease